MSELTDETAESNIGQKQKLLVGSVAAILVVVGILTYATLARRAEAPSATDLSESESQTEGVESLSETVGGAVENPLGESPELNPVERVNPFKDAYKNPFE